jgi:GT2 family glycosyltransferase
LEAVFDRLIDHIRSGRGHIVAPLAIDGNGHVQDSFRPLPTPLELFRRRTLGEAGATLPDPLEPVTPDWIAGFFQLMPASLYAELGGMDERFRLYLEDVDFCTRARLAGYRMLVDPTIRFRHDGRRASKRELRFFLWHLGSALRFFTSPVYRRARTMNRRAEMVE